MDIVQTLAFPVDKLTCVVQYCTSLYARAISLLRSVGVRARYDVVYHRLRTLKFFGAQAMYTAYAKNVDEKAELEGCHSLEQNLQKVFPTLLLWSPRIYSRLQADYALPTLSMTSTGKSSR